MKHSVAGQSENERKPAAKLWWWSRTRLSGRCRCRWIGTNIRQCHRTLTGLADCALRRIAATATAAACRQCGHGSNGRPGNTRSHPTWTGKSTGRGRKCRTQILFPFHPAKIGVYRKDAVRTAAEKSQHPESAVSDQQIEGCRRHQRVQLPRRIFDLHLPEKLKTRLLKPVF